MSIFLGAIKKNELPLPKSTLKELSKLRDSIDEKYRNYNNSKERDFYFTTNAIIYNTMKDLYDYEYTDGIRKLNSLREFLPDAIDYDKHIKLILQAKKRYDSIEI